MKIVINLYKIHLRVDIHSKNPPVNFSHDEKLEFAWKMNQIAPGLSIPSSNILHTHSETIKNWIKTSFCIHILNQIKIDISKQPRRKTIDFYTNLL